MPTPVHYIPIVTTIVTIPFTIVLFRHWRSKPQALYLAWWMFGVAMYGVGTLTESLTTLMGWNPVVFRAWYISGALLGGVPLAQGTMYLMARKEVAHRITVVIVAVIAVASLCILASPLDLTRVETHRLSGTVLEWSWVRLFSIPINTYALIALVGGALYSAYQYRRSGQSGRRVWGNVLIAVGALLPGIGGSFTRAGYVEVLYVTEIVGITCIWLGYHAIVRDSSTSIHVNQKAVQSGQDADVSLETVA
jgi:hypothetical protein